MKYSVKVTLYHWIDVEADNENEAFEIAEDLIPTFTSYLDDREMEVDTLYTKLLNSEENI